MNPDESTQELKAEVIKGMVEYFHIEGKPDGAVVELKDVEGYFDHHLAALLAKTSTQAVIEARIKELVLIPKSIGGKDWDNYRVSATWYDDRIKKLRSELHTIKEGK